MRLGKPADQIPVGSVLRITEEDFGLVECFRAQNSCRVTRVCRLRELLDEALAAFFTVVDGRTLADLMARPKQFAGELLRD
jgi:Rrf2 family nitric oxide-sensitive transcriptional repressor